MSKIVYYPNARDIFDIAEVDGIQYYLIDKENHKSKRITNRFLLQDCINSTEVRPIEEQLNNALKHIVDKVLAINKNKISICFGVSHFGFKSGEYIEDCGELELLQSGKISQHCDISDIRCNEKDIYKWKVVLNQMIGYSYFYDERGMSIGGNRAYILKPGQVCAFNYFCVRVCNSKAECDSVVQYLNTKFIKYIILNSLISTSMGNRETWRFVPDPGSFDHIFTDNELYKKYSLTADEISLIESVIKERK